MQTEPPRYTGRRRRLARQGEDALTKLRTALEQKPEQPKEVRGSRARAARPRTVRGSADRRQAIRLHRSRFDRRARALAYAAVANDDAQLAATRSIPRSKPIPAASSGTSAARALSKRWATSAGHARIGGRSPACSPIRRVRVRVAALPGAGHGSSATRCSPRCAAHQARQTGLRPGGSSRRGGGRLRSRSRWPVPGSSKPK